VAIQASENINRLLETIRVENGRFYNLPYHSKRFNAARKELFGISEPLDLAQVLKLPGLFGKGTYKCRLIYDASDMEIKFVPYERKTINSLKLVYSEDIEYTYKYEDRSALNELANRRGDCDEVVIVKNGFITDTSYSNIVFFDGKQWFTPSTPLLEGTMRAKLIEDGEIIEAEIKPEDLHRFKYFALILVFVRTFF